MAGKRLVLGALALGLGLTLFAPAGQSAQQCDERPSARSSHFSTQRYAAPRRSQSRHTFEFAAQRRPQVTIYPRDRYSPGRNSKRHCRSWLAKEYRLSGTVIVPKMRCWWE